MKENNGKSNAYNLKFVSKIFSFFYFYLFLCFISKLSSVPSLVSVEISMQMLVWQFYAKINCMESKNKIVI